MYWRKFGNKTYIHINLIMYYLIDEISDYLVFTQQELEDEQFGILNRIPQFHITKNVNKIIRKFIGTLYIIIKYMACINSYYSVSNCDGYYILMIIIFTNILYMYTANSDFKTTYVNCTLNSYLIFK